MSTTKPIHGRTVSALEEDRMRQAAELQLQARRALVPIVDLPIELRPRTLEEAYALQDVVAAAMGPIGGWKVGAEPGSDSALFGNAVMGRLCRIGRPDQQNSAPNERHRG